MNDSTPQTTLLTMEEWRDVLGYEGFYEVSDAGNVRSLPRLVAQRHKQLRIKGRILKQCFTQGHYGVNLHKNDGGYYHHVHVLVAAAFIGPRPDGHHTHHINGDSTDNRSVNLRYIPHSSHASHHMKGDNRSNATINQATADWVRHLISVGLKRSQVIDIVGISVHVYKDIQRGKTWLRP